MNEPAAPATPETPRIETREEVMFFDTDCGGVVHNIAYLVNSPADAPTAANQVYEAPVQTVTGPQDVTYTYPALDEKAKDFLVEKGYDPQYGARPMRRAVERHLEDPLAEHLLRGNIKSGDRIAVTCEEDGKTLKFTPNKGEEGNEEPCEVVDSAG